MQLKKQESVLSGRKGVKSVLNNPYNVHSWKKASHEACSPSSYGIYGGRCSPIKVKNINMSTGLFMGIKESYVSEAQENAERYIKEINKILIQLGKEKYVETGEVPDVYKGCLFGRSGLDHHSSSCLRRLGEFARSKNNANHLKLIEMNPYRVAFLPIEFEQPFMTDYKEQFWGGDLMNINAGSSFKLKIELEEIANELGIEITDGNLNDEQIRKINNLEALSFGEDIELIEDLRSAWLLVYEGANLSLVNNIALSLAG